MAEFRAAWTRSHRWRSSAAGAGPGCRSTRARSPSRSSRSAACPSSGTSSGSTPTPDFPEFVLCTGYLGEQIEAFVAAHDGWPDGARDPLRRHGPRHADRRAPARRRRAPGRRRPTFCATYADGVADVDLRELLAFHAAHDGEATMTVVRPELQFGVTELDADGARRRLPREAALRALGQRRLLRLRPRRARPPAAPTASSSARRWRAWPPTASCAPSATTASGTAWTPTRTPSCSTTCGPRARPRGRPGSARPREPRDAGHRRLRACSARWLVAALLRARRARRRPQARPRRRQRAGDRGPGGALPRRARRRRRRRR